MKRRKFFKVTSLSAAGLSLAVSCSSNKKPADLTGEAKPVPVNAPDYRKMIKNSFPKVGLKSANDTVVLALIGAGGQGNTLALQTSELGENIRFKYICDVDDTRGGACY